MARSAAGLLCCALLAVAVFGVCAEDKKTTSITIDAHKKSANVDISLQKARMTGSATLYDYDKSHCTKTCKESCKPSCKPSCHPVTVKKCKDVPSEVESCKDVKVTKTVKECKNTCDEPENGKHVTVAVSGENLHLKAVTISAGHVGDHHKGRKLLSGGKEASVTVTKDSDKKSTSSSSSSSASLDLFTKCAEVCQDVDKEVTQKHCEKKKEISKECVEEEEDHCDDVCQNFCTTECSVDCTTPEAAAFKTLTESGKVAKALKP